MMSLSDIMEFDHVIEVDQNGDTHDRSDIYAPGLHDGDLESSRWSLLDGFSRQDRYSGPMMHASEYVGGGLERHILRTPGIYVTLVDYPICDDDCQYCEGEGCEPDQWAVAVRSEPDMTRNANGSWYCNDCKCLVILFDDDTHSC